MKRSMWSLLESGSSVVALTVGISGFGATAFAGGALPNLGKFAAGAGAISKSGGKLTISQSSATGIIDWKSFSVGKTNAVTFDNGKGATLNEVTGGGLSRIDGTLRATGSVYLINNAGVLVSRTGVIDTIGNFAAMSGSVDNDAFSNDKRLVLTGKAKGNIANEGVIHSADGTVTLNGRNLSNTGTVTARNAALIAGDTASIAGTITAHDRVETSGGTVHIGNAKISAHDWLVDPDNLTVTSSAASAIDSSLDGGTNVTLKTTATTASGPGTKSAGGGDIIVAAPITWSGAATLSLDSYHSIVVDDAVTAKSGGFLTVTFNAADTDGDLIFGAAGQIVFDITSSSLNINGDAYTLVDSLAQLNSDIGTDNTGYFALAHDIVSTGTYTAAPVNNAYNGTFEGLGNTISNLSINSDAANAALFSELDSDGVLRDVRLTNVDIVDVNSSNDPNVGALVGTNSGAVIGDSASGKIVGAESGYTGGLVGNSSGDITRSTASDLVVGGDGGGVDLGGLVGFSSGSITDSSASGDVNGGSDFANVGGLAGENQGLITGAKATGNVLAGSGVDAGGLVGKSDGGEIKSSIARGSVQADENSSVGGLVGYSDDDIGIVSSIASGDITASDSSTLGGLVGLDIGTVVAYSHASGSVISSTSSDAGGLVGDIYPRAGGHISINHSYAVGNVTHASYTNFGSFVGGLVGYSDVPIKSSTASGTVTGTSNDKVGGLVGKNDATINLSSAAGIVTGGESSDTGGLVGYDTGSVTRSHSTGAVTGGDDADVGGLVGQDTGSITHSYSTASVRGGNSSITGGLVGSDSGTGISHVYATGPVKAAVDSDAGGLVGNLDAPLDHGTASGSVISTGEAIVGGLVGYNQSTITVSDATGYVQGGGKTGGLVGQNSDVITSSYATGDVDGSADVGGLVGDNEMAGTIQEAFATGDITTQSGGNGGGLAGYSDGTVTNAYALGTVSGYNANLGGLVGLNDTAGVIGDAYSAGTLFGESSSEVGGSIGSNQNTTLADLTDIYWDSTRAGTTGIGTGTANTNVKGKTSAQLQAGLPTGLTSPIWGESATTNDGLPYLIGITP